jgi:nitroreductase
MELEATIKNRRSVRSYTDEPVSDEALVKVLEAGRLAPSANNRQPWHFIVVKDPHKRKILSEGKYAKFLTSCPVVIVGCGDKVKSEKWHAIDTTIALENMVLQATSQGLGTCWIGSFNGEDVRKALNVPDNFSVIAMLAVGHPKDTPVRDAILGRSSRRALDEIVSWEEFGKPKTA